MRMGELVLALDPARLEAQLAEGGARRDQAKARLAELVRGPRREAIEEGQARLAAAESALENAAAELGRARALAAADFESRSRIDALKTRLAEAEGRRDEAAARLGALLEGTTLEELAQARSALDAAEAAVDELRIRRQRLDVRATRDGRVDSLPYELGERPAAGAAVAVLLADGPIYARIHVPAEVQSRIAPGAAAQVRVEGRSEPLRGRLRWVSSDPAFTPFYALTEHDRGRLSYLAEVDLLEGGDDLVSGTPTEVTFELDQTNGAGGPDAGNGG
jgi:HlyD family secretion protein